MLLQASAQSDFENQNTYYFAYETEGNWVEGRQGCMESGGDMAFFAQDGDEADSLSEIDFESGFYWVAVTDNAIHGTYQQINGKPGYFAWGPGQPSHRNHHCVDLNVRNLRIYDVSCESTMRPTICVSYCDSGMCGICSEDDRN
jgi:hypothetical protein